MARTYTNNLMASPEGFEDEIGLARIWFAAELLGLGARYHRAVKTCRQGGWDNKKEHTA